MNAEDRIAIEGHTLILFDGVCAMCNGVVRFLIRRKSSTRLIYAPLQSTLGQEMLFETGLSPRESSGRAPLLWMPDGVVLIEAALTSTQKISNRSDAAAQTLLLLSGAWPLVGRMLIAVPRSLREWAYGCVARWRYRIFGAYASCPIPSAEERSSILGTGS